MSDPPRKVSFVIPTLNEEATIGKEVIIFKSELMDQHPLLDEIAASPAHGITG